MKNYSSKYIYLNEFIDDPVSYIQQYSQQKREKLENGAEPERIFKAREKAGHFRFKDLVQKVCDDATD